MHRGCLLIAGRKPRKSRTASEQNNNSGVPIVTGATGGMGSATAVELVKQGWPLVLCDLDAGRARKGRSALRASGLQAEILAADIAGPAFSDRLAAVLGHRAIGAVVHAADLSPTMAEADRIFAVNWDATVRLLEMIRPRMEQGSCPVLISSSSA